jgi:hypothetical protein
MVVKSCGDPGRYILEIVLQVLVSSTPRGLGLKRSSSAERLQAPVLKPPLTQAHVILFIHACLNLSPLETIAACRHLRLWKALLGATGMERRGEMIDVFARDMCSLEVVSSGKAPTVSNPDAQLYIYRIVVPMVDTQSQALTGGPTTGGTSSPAEEGTAPRGRGESVTEVHPFLAWMRVQDLCLELFHGVLLAAQRPPTTNFISSPTQEVGVVVAILEREDEASDVTILQVCRWLHMMIIEHESLGAAAFNEHGQRILTLLPRLLERHKLYWGRSGSHPEMPMDVDGEQAAVYITPDTKFNKERPLWWPAHHALLSLIASIINVASTSESKLTLEYCFSGMIATDGLGLRRVESYGKETTLMDYVGRGIAKSGLDVFFDLLSYESCQSSAIFIITRLMHTLAQMSRDNLGKAVSPTPGDQGLSGLSMIYHEYLHDLCVRASQGNNAAIAQMFRGLCVLLREPQYSHLLTFHQIQLRKAGIFTVLAEIIEMTLARFGPPEPSDSSSLAVRKLSDRPVMPDFVFSIVAQGVSLLTALICGNKGNKIMFRTVFLNQRSGLLNLDTTSSSTDSTQGLHQESRLLQVLLRGSRASFETVRLLFDLLVDGCFPIDLVPSLRAMEDVQDSRCNDCKAELAVMKNREVVDVIFQLMPALSDELQISTLQILGTMVSGRLCELNSDLRAMLMDLVLDIVVKLPDGPQQAAIDLMSEVGGYYLNVAQLKRIFRLLNAQDEFRPAYTWMLLDALQKMVKVEEGPSQYFLFDGKKSGLRLPPITNWSRKHYSMCTWLHVDPPPCGGTCGDMVTVGGAASSLRGAEDTVADRYKPYIFSLLSEDGTAIEAYLCRAPEVQGCRGGAASYVLQLEHRRGKSCQVVQWKDANQPEFVPPRIVEGRWQFIGISHKAPSFRSNSELLVVVDGNVFRGNLNYPGCKSTSRNSFIGRRTGLKAHRNSTDRYEVDVNYCLKGKVGSIYFFDELLSESQLRGIYVKGANYSFSFEPVSSTDASEDAEESAAPPSPPGSPSSTTSSRDGPGLASIDGSIVSKVMLLFHPGSYRNATVAETSGVAANDDANDDGFDLRGLEGSEAMPVVDRRKRRIFELLRAATGLDSRTQATLMRGTYVNNCKDVRDAFDSLGGIKVLYPLFAQFDLPIRGLDGAPDYTVDPRLCVKFLDLLAKLLYHSHSGSNRRFMQEGNGFVFIGYFLERLSPMHMSLDLLEAITRLLKLLER